MTHANDSLACGLQEAMVIYDIPWHNITEIHNIGLEMPTTCTHISPVERVSSACDCQVFMLACARFSRCLHCVATRL